MDCGLDFVKNFCRLEKVNMRKLHCQAKILGTIGTVGGAMIMTMVNGPMLPLPWTKVNNQHQSTNIAATTKEDPLKGAVMILVGCVCWACFVILQVIFLLNSLKLFLWLEPI